MLSRLVLRGTYSACSRSQSFRKSILQLHPTFTTSAVVASDKTGPPANIPREYPNPTSKRDYINYPKLHLRETSPPVRFLCIPESFFTFMYPKTGYTGFHMFMFTTFTYFASQETFTCIEEFPVYVGELYLVTIVYYKYGDKLGEIYNRFLKKNIENLDFLQERQKIECRLDIKELKKLLQVKPAIEELAKTNTDIIHLQLENSFRERMMTVHKQVKNKLDCFVQLESAKNAIILKFLKNFIMSSVMSSITPELEKNFLQKSINDLNSLAAKV